MRVTYQDHPDDLKNAEFLSARALEIAQAAGARKAWLEPVKPQTQSVHLLGTCRMGNDPRSSVIDRYHRDARRPESLHLRRQQHGHLVARAADRDDLGARLPCGGTYRGVCEEGRDLSSEF